MMMKTSNSRVFIVERSRQDVSPLEDYGRATLLFTERDARPGIFEPLYEDAVLAKLEAAAFDPDEDYLAVVGPTVPVVRTVAAALRRYGRLRALMFNASFRAYTVVMLGDSLHYTHRRHYDAARTGRRVHAAEESSRGSLPPLDGGPGEAVEHGPAGAR